MSIKRESGGEMSGAMLTANTQPQGFGGQAGIRGRPGDKLGNPQGRTERESLVDVEDR